MRIAILGYRFDTEKASNHWELARWVNNNMHCGDIYRSSRGTWYAHTPAQEGGDHEWTLIEPAAALERYGTYLTETEINEISTIAELDWE